MTKPSELLKEAMYDRFLDRRTLAKSMKISEEVLGDILSGKTAIDTAIAEALHKAIPDITKEYWINRQDDYDQTLVKDYSDSWDRRKPGSIYYYDDHQDDEDDSD